MAGVNPIYSALGGIQKATEKLEKAADDIAHFGQEDAVDRFPDDIVDLQLAKAATYAAIAVIKTADEMDKSVIDILA